MFYGLLIAMLVLLDQYTKYLTIEKLQYGETISLVDGFFHLTYVKNMGIAFGIFQDKTIYISLLTVAAVLGISFYFYKEFKKIDIWEKIAYSFILAGATGNMIDRVFRGYVIDMMDFRGIWIYVFNVADVWINVGVFFLVVDYFVRRNER
ncbi:MAG: signal peptidase II [Fusobacteriaceae bacterium]